ncbi:hypothetical protein L21TH_0597 [Caldisalinibacter kiritimatiensis]|uniref:Uncharacterized protein n=1 Tax=Caldisalinibacter kiritimatiensis TaxID=1304284 RepID=R1CRS6_9FIRM|nr:hypothetical protein L21TH_0597 [Caldisalinibacter kiritimatiensis]
MFGYVTPHKAELKVKEYNLFKGYYCGLCKALGKEFNQLVRFGLNYDITFLGLLLSSLDERKETIRPENCIAAPFKKKPIVQPNKYIEYAANISVILFYFKLLDDWKDEKSLKALVASTAYLLPVYKAKKVYKDKYISIKSDLKRLTELEKKKCKSIDESADAFARLMGTIAVPNFIKDEKTSRVLNWLGYNLGRWIYILDAFNDIEKDIKKNNYNPILLQYNYKNNESVGQFINRVKEPIEFTLTFTLDNIAKSYELLDVKRNRSIIENIIYMGTRHKMQQILYKGVVKNEKSI